MEKLVSLLIWASLLAIAVAWWRQDALPEPGRLLQQLAEEPRQTETSRPPFQTTVGDVVYTVKPLYEYDLYGLVVSKHNADSWWDYIHAAWNDKLNVTDLCVIWGDNALQGRYRKVSFSSGQFVCYFETSSQEAFEAFDPAQLSNNHLLSDNLHLSKRLREVRIGDQVHFRGVLAEYSHHHGFAFWRGSSTVRTDSGNGACETVYVSDAEILRGDRFWSRTFWVAAILFVAGIVTKICMPYRVFD